MVGHLFQNYDTIYVRFFPTYTCNHFCYTIYVRFLSRILAFYSQVYDHFLTNAHIYAHKKAHMRYKQACGIWGHRKLSYKTHRIIPSTKNPFMYDGRVNFEQGLVLIHYPHSSDGCWLPDNEFVGIYIRGLSLERLCTPTEATINSVRN